MKEAIKKIFELNPKLDEVFETSDGNVFYLEVDAKNHAKTLKKNSVEKHLRFEKNNEATDQVKEIVKEFISETIKKTVVEEIENQNKKGKDSENSATKENSKTSTADKDTEAVKENLKAEKQNNK